MPALIRSLKEQMVFALDSMIVSCEDALQADKDRFKELDWDFLSYVKSQVHFLVKWMLYLIVYFQLALSDLYRSLGLRDQVLAQCDEMEALLSLLMYDFGRSGMYYYTLKSCTLRSYILFDMLSMHDIAI